MPYHTPLIKTIPEKKLVGIKLPMNLAQNRTAELWKNFMPRRKEILNAINTDLISLQEYNENYFSAFSPQQEFVKWATIEVTDFNSIPENMESLILPSGLYAMFPYKGSSADGSIFRFIFETWLPASGYALDHRPHFEVLGAKYKNNDPESEEEIWIPIR